MKLNQTVALFMLSCVFGCAETTGELVPPPRPPPPPPPPAVNQAPAATSAISAVELEVGQSITDDLSSRFTDPDGDELTFTAESADTDVVAASVAGAAMTLTGVDAGETEITVTATDRGGLSAAQTAAVTVLAPNVEPAVADTIPALEVNTGADLEVDLSPYFTDPDGDELTFTAESADTDVVAASVAGAAMTLTGVDAGETEITVTATDPGGLSAAQTAAVTVVATNRAPVVVADVRNIMLTPGGAQFVELDELFRDPDGDPLAYAFVSSDTTIVQLVRFETSLHIRARPEITGVATVTITATDPDGASVTASIQVEVTTSSRTTFRDDFDGDELSRDWSLVDAARIQIEDGLLKVTATVPGEPGTVISRELALLSSIVARSRLAFGTIENTSLSLLFFGADPEGKFISILNLQIMHGRMLDGQRVNYYAGASHFRAADEVARPIETLAMPGFSDAVPDSVGEFVELKLTTEEDRLRVWIDDEQLFDVELPEWVYPVRSVWLLVDGGDSFESGQVGWFDWVDVEGNTSVEASRSRLGTQKSGGPRWVGLFDQIRKGGGTP